MEYGLIGARLGHSFSAQIHKALAPHSEYELCELPEEDDARRFFAQREFCAVNVTIPYKQLALAACDEVDEKAAAIGAVNTVVNRGGRLLGCNTDYAGFLYMARRAGTEFRGKNVLVLGTGGTSKTVRAAAADEGAACVLHASRTGRGGALTYEEAAARAAQFDIIVNTTPAGMYPDEDACAADPREYPNVRAVLDVVYNPMRTELLQRAQEAGARVADGLPMLVAQAFYAREHFEGRALDAQRIEQVLRALRADRANLVLVGMPSCGKSGVGKACAQALHKRFVDADSINVRTGPGTDYEKKYVMTRDAAGYVLATVDGWSRTSPTRQCSPRSSAAPAGPSARFCARARRTRSATSRARCWPTSPRAAGR